MKLEIYPAMELVNPVKRQSIEWETVFSGYASERKLAPEYIENSETVRGQLSTLANEISRVHRRYKCLVNP